MGTAKTQGAAYAAPENRERKTENGTRGKRATSEAKIKLPRL